MTLSTHTNRYPGITCACWIQRIHLQVDSQSNWVGLVWGSV